MTHIAECIEDGTIVTVFCRRFVGYDGRSIDLPWEGPRPSSRTPSCLFCIATSAQYTPVYGAYISCTVIDPREGLYAARVS